tara:strand:- start:4796 stop:6481 length:1686 start_codon:yes stop_codon:yes gene_type:complete
MGYRPKSTDELLGTGETGVLGTAFAMFQQYQSIMQGLEERDYLKETRRNKKRDYQLGVVDEVGKKLEKAVSTNDRKMSLEYASQLKELGGKITDDGNPLTRASYKAHHSFAEDVEKDVALMDDFDEYLATSQKRGGEHSYDYYAAAKDADEFEKKAEDSITKINEWKVKLRDAGINEKLYSNSLNTQEATVSKLRALGGFNKDLPKSMKSFERQFFNNSLTGQGTMTQEEAFKMYQNDQIRNETKLESTRELLEKDMSMIADLQSSTDLTLDPEATATEISARRETSIRYQGEIEKLEARQTQLDDILNDERTADWAGIGLTSEWENSDWDKHDSGDKIIAQSKIDDIKIWNPDVKLNADGKIIDGKGELYSPSQTAEMHEELRVKNIESIAKVNKEKEDVQVKEDKAELGDLYDLAKLHNMPAFHPVPEMQRGYKDSIGHLRVLSKNLDINQKKLDEASVSLAQINLIRASIENTKLSETMSRKEKSKAITDYKSAIYKIEKKDGIANKRNNRGSMLEGLVTYSLSEKDIQKLKDKVDEATTQRKSQIDTILKSVAITPN